MSEMMVFYPQIKLVHICAASLSGTLFSLRALGLLAGQQWPRLALLRYLSYCVDTILLTAAMMLLTILPNGYFGNGWLWMKVALVGAYVVLGICAFRPALGKAKRAGLVVTAWLCFLQIIGIAYMHHPAGWWLWLQA